MITQTFIIAGFLSASFGTEDRIPDGSTIDRVSIEVIEPFQAPVSVSVGYWGDTDYLYGYSNDFDLTTIGIVDLYPDVIWPVTSPARFNVISIYEGELTPGEAIATIEYSLPPEINGVNTREGARSLSEEKRRNNSKRSE